MAKLASGSKGTKSAKGKKKTVTKKVTTSKAEKTESTKKSKTKEKPKFEGVCGAKTRNARNDADFCRLRAGFGTDHIGTGRCMYHGGRNKGPTDPSKLKGNRNGVTSGRHEMLFWEHLTDDEREFALSVNVDTIYQITCDITLIDIRINRMLARIAKLSGAPMSVVKRVLEEGENAFGEVRILHTTEESTLGQIIAVEEALTKVLENKRKMLDLKARLEEGLGDDTGSLEALAMAINNSTKMIIEKRKQEEEEEEPEFFPDGSPV